MSILERCPSYKESNKRSKERQGPTLGVRFTEVSVKRESTLFEKKSLPNIYRLFFTQVNSLNFFFLLLNPWMKSYTCYSNETSLTALLHSTIYFLQFCEKKFEFFGLHFTLRPLIRVKGFMLFF